jgi:hypothetical protein
MLGVHLYEVLVNIVHDFVGDCFDNEPIKARILEEKQGLALRMVPPAELFQFISTFGNDPDVLVDRYVRPLYDLYLECLEGRYHD